MEEVHRAIIQTNYSTLVKECDINPLLPILVKKKVFSKEMITKYTNEPDNLRKKRNLFMDVQMRGPYAFRNLVAALRETNQNRMANLLDPNSNSTLPAVKKRAVPFMLPTNAETTNIQSIHNISSIYLNDCININQEPIKIDVKGSTSLYDDPTRNVPIYSTHSKKRGIALIINLINYDDEVVNPTRNGAEVDGKNLKELFLQMGLAVEAHEDLTGDEIRETIANFKDSPKLQGVDMVFVIIMGHGLYAGEEGCLIPGTDNRRISTVWIEQQFDNVHCKLLQNRPKIIMYQICRGNVPDYGVTQRIETDSAARVLRSRTDLLVAHSTLSGYVSHRDTFLGAWYIQKFCENMMNHAHDTHLEDIFKMVDAALAHLRTSNQTTQTSTYTNQGFKICYVHPKIYAEEGIIKDIFNDLPVEFT